MVGLHHILAGNVEHNYYMLVTTTKLSMPFQVLGLWLHLKEIFLGLGLTVTEMNIKKKYRNKKIKTFKMKKDVGMACQKYANKVGMIYVIMNVNLQNPIPTSFYTTVAN